MSLFQPSKYQQATFDFVSGNHENIMIPNHIDKSKPINLAISAVAGSGKSTTLLEMLSIVPNDKQILTLAFNRDIVEVLTEKVNEKKLFNVQVKTLHSFGMSAINFNAKGAILDKRKYLNIIDTMMRYGGISFEDQSEQMQYVQRVQKLVDFGRYDLVTTVEELENLANHHDIELTNGECQFALDVIKRGTQMPRIFDYTDMIYLPVALRMKMKQHDITLIDECVSSNTILNTQDGDVKISDINIGDFILAYDERKKEIVYDEVVNKWEKGKKQTYRLMVEDNKFIDCTENHKILTNFGWLYVNEIITKINNNIIIECYTNEYHERKSKTINTWQSFGGHVHRVWGQKIFKVSKNKSKTFKQTGKVCLAKIQNIEKLCENRAKNNSKSRIWKFFSNFWNIICSRIDIFLQYNQEEWKKICDERMVGFVDRGRSGLLVYGRWFGFWLWQSMPYCNIFFFLRRAFSHKAIFQGEMEYCGRYQNSQREISLCQYECRKQKQISQNDKTIHDRITHVQDSHIGEVKNLSNLSKRIQRESTKTPNMFKRMFKGIYKQIQIEKYYKSTSEGKNKIHEGKKDGKSRICSKLSLENGCFKKKKITSIAIKEIETVYDIETKNTHTFFGNNILVHNCQDLSKCQRELMLRTLKPMGYFIAVGDPSQSIYGFSGSSIDSFDQMANLPNTMQLPLSICYRCDKKIVELAKEYVPEIESRENAQDGEVNQEATLNEVKEGDLIMCRNTFPLVVLCMKYLASGKKAFVVGKDISENLINLIKPYEKRGINAMHKGLKEETKKIGKKIMIKDGIKESELTDHPTYQTFVEKIQAIEAIGTNCKTVGEIIEKIKSIFQDKDSEGIRLSTVHKAKGLESDRVFIIHRELMPAPYARKIKWMLQQEHNLTYVAITRAKHYLGYITDFDAYKKQKQ